MMFLDLVELSDCDATGICDASKKILENNGLELKKLVSVMTRVNSGNRTEIRGSTYHPY